MKVLVAQSCLTLCDPKDCRPPVSSVHGILQARILKWVVIHLSRGSFQPRYRAGVSCIAGRFYAHLHLCVGDRFADPDSCSVLEEEVEPLPSLLPPHQLQARLDSPVPSSSEHEADAHKVHSVGAHKQNSPFPSGEISGGHEAKPHSRPYMLCL